jgi:DNA polymerase (family 10)
LVKNAELAKAMREIAFLTEVEDGDNSQFKARAYYRASDTIASLPENVADIYDRQGTEGLLEIPSIGKAIASKIEEFIKTGGISHLEELKTRISINVDELYGIEGIGPKTIKMLYDRLKIKNLAELEAAATQGKLKSVPGFTERKEQEILKRIVFFKKGKGRRIIGEIYPLARQIESRLLNVRGVRKAVVAGSLRRMKETIGDIDYIVVAAEPEEAMEFFTNMAEVEEVVARGPSKAFVRLAGGIDADLLIVPEESWGSALQYFTGSKEHSVEIRKIAIAKGLRLNEWGVFRDDNKIAGATE